MGGIFGGGTTTTTNAPPGPIQVFPGFSPFATSLGQILNQLITADQGVNPFRFAEQPPFPTPPLTPLQQAATDLISQRTQNGILPPMAESLNLGQLAQLPGTVGQSVPESPYWQVAQQAASQMADVSAPNESQLAGLSNFATANTPVDLSQYGLQGLGTAQLASRVGGTPNAPTQQGVRYLGGANAQVPFSPYIGQGLDVASLMPGFGQVNPVQQSALQGYGQVGNQVPISPLTRAGVGTAGQAAMISQPNDLQGQSAETLQQFASGDFGNSPAIQAAVQALRANIAPAIENNAARIGLANSGELVREIANSYAQQLVPLYQQGLQQQQAAGTQLGTLGAQEVQQQLQGLQTLEQAQLSAGQTDQALQTEALIRQLQAAGGLSSLGTSLSGLGLQGSQAYQGALSNAGQIQQQLGTDALQRQLSAGGQLGQLGLGSLQQQLASLQALSATQQSLGQQQQALQTDALIRQLQGAQGLLSGGTTLAQQQMQGLGNVQQLAQTQAANQQQLGTDAYTRYLQSVLGSSQPLQGIAASETAQPIEQINEAMQGGQLQQGVQQQALQNLQGAFGNQQQMSLGMLNPGSMSVVGSPATNTKTNQQQSGLFK